MIKQRIKRTKGISLAAKVLCSLRVKSYFYDKERNNRFCGMHLGGGGFSAECSFRTACLQAQLQNMNSVNMLIVC